MWITNNRHRYIKSNFTKWDGPLFEPDNGCVYFTPDGKWKPYSKCWAGRTCPICGFVGTPIFTLKGDNNYYKIRVCKMPFYVLTIWNNHHSKIH